MASPNGSTTLPTGSTPAYGTPVSSVSSPMKFTMRTESWLTWLFVDHK